MYNRERGGRVRGGRRKGKGEREKEKVGGRKVEESTLYRLGAYMNLPFRNQIIQEVFNMSIYT